MSSYPFAGFWRNATEICLNVRAAELEKVKVWRHTHTSLYEIGFQPAHTA